MSARSMRLAWVPIAVLLLICPSRALAREKIRFGVSAFGGYNTYQMTTVNKYVNSVLNDVIAVLPSTVEKVWFDDIGNGLGFGGGLHAWMTNDVLLSVEYERLMAKSSKDVASSGTPYHTECKIPANGFTLTGAYFLPSASKARFGLGAGVGYYSTKATVDFSSQGKPVKDTDLGLGQTGDPILSGELKGSGFGLHGVGIMEYAATSRIHADLRIGLRLAKTTELEDKATGEALENDKGEKVKADWGGILLRAGFTFFFGKAD